MVSVLSLQPTSPLHHPPSLRPRVLTLAPIVLSDMLGEKGPEKEEVVWMEWWIQKRGWLKCWPRHRRTSLGCKMGSIPAFVGMD